MTPLTQQERARFAAYLEEDAAQNVALAEQMEKLPMPVIPMAKKMRTEAMAEKIVANMLRSISSETL